MDLEVTGEPNSLVGLLAVDKAVYLLKDKHRLQTETVCILCYLMRYMLILLEYRYFFICILGDH